MPLTGVMREVIPPKNLPGCWVFPQETPLAAPAQGVGSRCSRRLWELELLLLWRALIIPPFKLEDFCPRERAGQLAIDAK